MEVAARLKGAPVSAQKCRLVAEDLLHAAREVNSRLHSRGRIAVLPLENPPSR